MPDSTPLNEQDARRLLRRTGFGAPQAQVVEFATLTRGDAVNELLSFKPQGFKPGGKLHQDAHGKWVKFMLKTKFPLQEKLVLFWHDHFATGISKVGDVKLMGIQNGLLRKNCKGHFGDLVKAINKDPAMMEYLDTVRNGKFVPNENYARELQELFTLGVKDSNGNDNYTQEDIVQIARAFTGWRYDKAKPYFNADDHDFNSEFEGPPENRGPKDIFKSTGGFGAGGVRFAGDGSPYPEGAAEIDTVVDLILQHRDSDGRNTVARRIARRLIEYFAGPSPGLAFIDDVVASSGFDTNWDLSALLHEIFVHDDFYTAARSVRWPIDYVVGSLRLLKMKLKGRDLYVDGGDYTPIFDQLGNMGQILLEPPSVFGWDWETAWISSSTLLARYGFARDLVMARSGGGSSLQTDKLIDLGLTDAGAIVDAVTSLLGVKDDLGAAEKAILVDYLTVAEGQPVTPDLLDDDYRNRKLHGLVALVMQSPAYQLH